MVEEVISAILVWSILAFISVMGLGCVVGVIEMILGALAIDYNVVTPYHIFIGIEACIIPVLIMAHYMG